MKITPILWTYDKLQDGTFSLKIRHSYVEDKKKIRKYYPLNIYLKESQWNASDCRVKVGKHPNASEINLKLIDIESLIEREYLKDPNINVEDLISKALNPNFKKSHTLISYFQQYTDKCTTGEIVHYKSKKRLSAGYIKTFTTCMRRLEDFKREKWKKEIHFNDVTEEFHERLVDYLRYEYDGTEEIGMAENTMAKTTKLLKTVMMHAMKKGKLHSNIEFMDFPATWHDVENIALDDSQVSAMITADLSDKKNRHLVKEQERFSIAYNFLLRFNDSISIDKRNVFFDNSEPFFRMYSGKTKQEVIIPIMPMNYEILKKNKFIMLASSNKVSNENLKSLGEVAGLTDDQTIMEERKGVITQTVYKRYQLITTHTTRRSAATNLYLANVDLKSIQLMGGWKNMAMLEKYIKIDKLQNAKRAAAHPFFKR